MDLSTANSIIGGIILGYALIFLAVILFAIRKVRFKKHKINGEKGLGKASIIVGIAGFAICIISLGVMIFTGSSGDVGSIFSVMRSTEKAIYNDKLYVKTDMSFNGNSDKYTLEKADSVLTGADTLYTVKGYEKYDVLVAKNSNITGVIFVVQEEETDFCKYYGDYENNYSTGAVFDKQDSKMTTVDKDADSVLYAKLRNSKNYTEAKKDDIPYVDEITSTRNCIFWASSNDELITSQVKIYPKDKNKKYVKTDGSKYYELNNQVGKDVDKYFK